MKEKEVQSAKEATNLKEYFKNNIESVAKTLIELFEFQENIEFVNTKIERR